MPGVSEFAIEDVRADFAGIFVWFVRLTAFNLKLLIRYTVILL